MARGPFSPHAVGGCRTWVIRTVSGRAGLQHSSPRVIPATDLRADLLSQSAFPPEGATDRPRLGRSAARTPLADVRDETAPHPPRLPTGDPDRRVWDATVPGPPSLPTRRTQAPLDAGVTECHRRTPRTSSERHAQLRTPKAETNGMATYRLLQRHVAIRVHATRCLPRHHETVTRCGWVPNRNAGPFPARLENNDPSVERSQQGGCVAFVVGMTRLWTQLIEESLRCCGRTRDVRSRTSGVTSICPRPR